MGDMEIITKQVVEFGQTVTLYRVVDEFGNGTLWHGTLEKALDHFRRLAFAHKVVV